MQVFVVVPKYISRNNFNVFFFFLKKDTDVGVVLVW
jgi:hypothetical protein